MRGSCYPRSLIIPGWFGAPLDVGNLSGLVWLLAGGDVYVRRL